MSVKVRRTPERNNPLFSGLTIEKVVPLNTQLTTAGGAVTLTPAQLLGGLLTLDVEDAQTATLPTAAALNAAIPGVEEGSSFEFTVINYGDATLTIALGSGVTNPAIGGLDAILTLATTLAATFRLVCTGVADDFVPGSSDSWVLYRTGASAAVLS